MGVRIPSSARIKTLDRGPDSFRVGRGSFFIGLELITSNTLEITLDKYSSNQASVKIKLEEADYQPNVDAKLKEYARKATMNGFRPGKVPIQRIQKMYGTSVLVEEINSILSNSLNDYIKKQDFKVLGDPLPVVEDADKIDWKEQKEFEFEYKIGFLEKIDLKIDESLQVKEYVLELSEVEINDAVENLRQQYGTMTNPEVSQEDDFLYGDLKSTDGSYQKSFSLPLSKVEKDSRQQFVGLEKGAEVKFEPKKVLGEELEQVLDISEEEASKIEGEYIFSVQNINRTEKAELNQEFFDKVFGPDQIKSEEEFFEKTRELLTANYNKEARVYNEEQIKEAVVKQADLDLPEEFLKEWLARTNEGKISKEEIEAEYPVYAKQMIWTLISNQIAEENGLRGNHEEVVEKTKDMIRQQFASSGMGAQLEDSLGTFADNYLQGKEGQNYMQMFSAVQNEKVIKYIREKINLQEERISVEDFKKLLEN